MGFAIDLGPWAVIEGNFTRLNISYFGPLSMSHWRIFKAFNPFFLELRHRPLFFGKIGADKIRYFQIYITHICNVIDIFNNSKNLQMGKKKK